MGKLRADMCREAFRDAGLTYADLTERDIANLAYVVGLNLGFCRDSPKTLYQKSMRLKRVEVDLDENGRVSSAFLRAQSEHFDDREAISFNKDGYIGFCGWADSKNEVPFVDAFDSWVKAMSRSRAMFVEALAGKAFDAPMMALAPLSGALEDG